MTDHEAPETVGRPPTIIRVACILLMVLGFGSVAISFSPAANPATARCRLSRDRIDRTNAREHISFGQGVHTCPGAPLARAEARVGIQRLLERTTDIRISEAAHGPAGARRYDYIPTYILRGVTKLHLEFTPVA